MKLNFLSKKEEKEEEPIEFIGEKQKEKEDITEKTLNFLGEEFKFESPASLKPMAKPDAPPLSVIHSEGESFSIWYRMLLRGESGVIHIPDFVLFKGVHRMPPRDKNPDIIIECRQINEERSNRTDSRIVRDMIGLSLDTLPGLCVLVTNRPISEYAKALASKFGIEVVNASSDSGSYELFKALVGNDLLTREKLYTNLDKNILKLESKFKAIKVKKAPKLEEVQRPAKSELRDLIIKALSSRAYSPRQLSRILRANDNLILNELYALEKEGRAKVFKRSKTGDLKDFEWALIKSS